MSPYQNLNENIHQNLNKLFYDIGWRVSKYVDGLQQIVPTANQLGTICRRSSLMQLVPVSPVPLESPSAALMPHRAHKKARIGPESLFVALSHTFAALSLTRSAALASQANARNISNYLRALPAALLLPTGWQAILRGLLSGGSTQQVSCEATQLTPNIQPMKPGLLDNALNFNALGHPKCMSPKMRCGPKYVYKGACEDTF